LDHERGDERRPKSGGFAPQEEKTAEITGERRDEQRKEQGAESAAVGAACVGRDDRSPLDPGSCDAPRNEKRGRTGRDERDPARRAIDPLGYSASAGSVVDGGGG
jgi:hypothetical protein